MVTYCRIFEQDIMVHYLRFSNIGTTYLRCNNITLWLTRYVSRIYAGTIVVIMISHLRASKFENVFYSYLAFMYLRGSKISIV